MLRSLARGVAKKRMKDRGVVHICKPNKGYGSYFANHWICKPNKGYGSYFANHWREYVYR